MQLKSIAASLLIATVLTARADDPAPSNGPGWTGLTNPADVIAARQALMVEIERLMRPIDALEVGEKGDPAELKSTAHTISQVLLALPHLFPPTTNLYDPNDETPPTIALPAIWQNFPTFYALAGATATAAKTMSLGEESELPELGDALRDSCDACHALFLRPYVPSKVSSDDLNFDFDSVLKK
jgi:cytochrome c556